MTFIPLEKVHRRPPERGSAASPLRRMRLAETGRSGSGASSAAVPPPVFAQVSVIQEMADRGSCVIVGRCADYILRDRPNCIKVFIYADRADRIERLKTEYSYTGNDVDQRLTKLDRGRANYYKHYTCENWGSVKNHDLSINTSVTGINGAAKIIETLVKELGYV